jgi:hypothetical protein
MPEIALLIICKGHIGDGYSIDESKGTSHLQLLPVCRVVSEENPQCLINKAA